MKIVRFDDIQKLRISPNTCLEWVKESFSLKNEALLPIKTSIHPSGIDFYTSMPCLLPKAYDRYFLKLVHRIKGGVPSLGSDGLIYQASTGELLALMDCNWITAMRTGAVATFAAQLFRKKSSTYYGIIGLGNTARATLLCLLESEPDLDHHIILHEYKDYVPLFQERFSTYKNVVFETTSDIEDLVQRSDVIFSCITQADELICKNIECYHPGCLIVPVHTRGFTNCDTVFDKVFADDKDHVKGFKFFEKFRYFAELQDVVLGRANGRENDNERILSYNVGIALHDALFASKIWDLVCESPNLQNINLIKRKSKFWV